MEAKFFIKGPKKSNQSSNLTSQRMVTESRFMTLLVVHLVPDQVNIKAVTGACKLIDGCSLELCSATPSVASSGICHRNIDPLYIFVIIFIYPVYKCL